MYKQNLVSICFPSGIFILFCFIYNRFVFLVEPDLPISRFEDSQIRFQEFKCNRSRRRNKDLRVIKIYICVRKITGFAGYRLGFRRFVDCGGLESNGIICSLMSSVDSSLQKQHGST